MLGIVLGLLALAIGIARFAFLGQFMARLFAGAPGAALAIPLVATLVAILLRPWLDHVRTSVAHRTAARVQEALRGRLYDKIVALGPAWFGAERTGGVMLSVVDGVEQLQAWFGQYLPQVAIAACAPFAIFAFMAWWDVPVAMVMLAAALFSLTAPAVVHKRTGHASRERMRAFKMFGEELLDAIQGLPTLKAFGQSGCVWPHAGGEGARSVREHDDGAGHQRADTRHHRSGVCAWRRGGAGAGRVSGAARRDEPGGSADRADGGDGDFPAAARTADGAASGIDGAGRCECDQRADR